MKRISALIVLVPSVFLVSSTVALAADPTQADFDTCNRMAQSKMSNPSALPRSEPQSDTRTQTTGGDTAVKPGSPVSPSAAPATVTPVTPSPAPTPGADTGTKPGTPVSPSAAPATEQPAVPPATAGASGPSSAADDVRGMAAAGQTDPVFRRAFMECMKGRGF